MPSAAASASTAAGASPAPRVFAFELAVPLILANGALDSYTYLAHDGVFATAQTGNIVLFAVGVIRPEVAAPLPHLWPIIAFCAGIVLAHAVHRPDHPTRSRRSRRWVLLTQVAVLSVIAAAPTAIPLWLVVSAISFTSALQLALMRTISNLTFVPIAMTGNLMRTVEAFYTAGIGGRQELMTALRYLTLIATFLAGVLLGALATTHFGGRAALVPAGLIMLDYSFIRLRHRIRGHSELGPADPDSPATVTPPAR